MSDLPAVLSDASDFHELYLLTAKVCEHLGGMTAEWYERHYPSELAPPPSPPPAVRPSGGLPGAFDSAPCPVSLPILVVGPSPDSRAAWCRRKAAREYRDQLRSQLLRLWRPGLPVVPNTEADAETDIRNSLTPWLMMALSDKSGIPPDQEGETAATAEISPDPPAQDVSAEEVGRLLHLMGDGDGVKVLSVAKDKSLTVDQRMRVMVRIDQRLAGKNSTEWAELLDVTPPAVRQSEFWKSGRDRKDQDE